jgi:hypothetical protein
MTLADSLFRLLQRDQRPGQAGLGSIQKQSHAQSLTPLQGNQAHMPADVVAVLQQGYLRLVELRILFQPRNPLFDGAAKPGTYLKAIAGCAVGHHGRLLERKLSLGKFLKKVKVSSTFADTNDEDCAAPDYGGALQR